MIWFGVVRCGVAWCGVLWSGAGWRGGGVLLGERGCCVSVVWYLCAVILLRALAPVRHVRCNAVLFVAVWRVGGGVV